MGADGSRALRALAAEMAQLGEDDVRAILDDLDVGSRARLMELIDSFRSGEGPVEPAAISPPSTGVSPGDWLLARLRPRQLAESDMTPHALQVLRRAALDTGWADASVDGTREVARPGLLARLGLRP